MKLRIDFNHDTPEGSGKFYNTIDVLNDYGVKTCLRWVGGLVTEVPDNLATEIAFRIADETACSVYRLEYELAVALEEINIIEEMRKIDAEIDAALQDLERADEWRLNPGGSL